MSGVQINGIDVSSYQGGVNWAQVERDGYSFGIPKATEGVGLRDPYFAANWSGVRAAGMVRGAYHFAHPEFNQPEAEADYFLSVVGPLSAGDFLALDLESNASGDLSSWALRWLEHVKAATGVAAFWYSYSAYINAHGLAALFGSAYPFWAVNPQSNYPDAPLLQLLSGGYIGDTDVFFGTQDQLRAYGLGDSGGSDMALTPDQEAQLADMLTKFPNLYRTAGYIFWALQITGADPDPTKAHSIVLDDLTAAVKALQPGGGGGTEPAEPKTLTIQGPITGTIQ